MSIYPTDSAVPSATSPRARAAWDAHAAALIAANEDRADGKKLADPCATPLLAAADFLPADSPLSARARDVGFRLDSVAFLIRGTSYEAWSSITRIEAMFSDIRRIAPRFELAQLRGEARIAAGNEYRLAIVDPAYLGRLNGAMAELAALHGSTSPPGGDAPFNVRRMDLRIMHAGPFGGETATMAWTTLASHRLTGLSSFWAVIHGDDDGMLRVSLEAAELFRWAWAPERLADMRHGAPPGDDARILDWRWYFERVAAALDGDPLTDATRALALGGSWTEIGADARLRDALAAHPSLAGLAARLDAGD